MHGPECLKVWAYLESMCGLGFSQQGSWILREHLLKANISKEPGGSCLAFSDLVSEIMQHHFTTIYQYWSTLNLMHSLGFVGPKNVHLSYKSTLGMLLVCGYSFWGQSLPRPHSSTPTLLSTKAIFLCCPQWVGVGMGLFLVQTKTGPPICLHLE